MASRYTDESHKDNLDAAQQRDESVSNDSLHDPGGGLTRTWPPKGHAERRKLKVSTVWKVVLHRLDELSDKLDIRLLRSAMWSAGLITPREYQRYTLETRTNSDHVTELLQSLIQSNRPWEFYKFLSVLEQTQKYDSLAKELRKEAAKIEFKDKQEGRGAHHSHLLTMTAGGGQAVSASTDYQHEESSADNDIAGDPSAGADVSTSPWKVVKRKLTELKNKIDVKILRTDLWTSGLIEFSEYSRYDLADKTRPELAEELLTSLIQNDQPQDFYTFLSVLQKVTKYQPLAKSLAEEVDCSGDNGRSQIHPFIVARRCNGKLWDIRIQDKTVYEIGMWHRARSEAFQEKITKPSPEFPLTGLEDEPEVVSESAKLLQVAVSLPEGLKGWGNRGVVVLAGEVEEIVAWLKRVMPPNSEHEFGKLLNQSPEYMANDTTADDELEGEMRAHPVISSGIYCLLPNGGDTIYIIVRLRWMDDPEVHVTLLRIALQMSPMWLIFYNKAGIEANRFCVEAEVEPKLPYSQCFGENFITTTSASTPLLDKLRRVFECFPCDDTAGEGGVKMLHIQFVFNVTLNFFSQTMVYHRQGIRGCEARCMIQAKSKFAVLATTSTTNEAVARARQGLPDISMGMSIQKRLDPPDVRGYKVDPDWWLKMSCGFVPIALCSCSVDCPPCSDCTNATVTCSVFPDPHEAAATRMVTDAMDKDLDESATDQVDCSLPLPPESSAKPVTERIAEAMGSHVKLPAPLSYTLAAWQGPVQVITCIGADEAETSQFLNSLTGSAFALYAHGQPLCDLKCSIEHSKPQNAIGHAASSSGNAVQADIIAEINWPDDQRKDQSVAQAASCSSTEQTVSIASGELQSDDKHCSPLILATEHKPITVHPSRTDNGMKCSLPTSQNEVSHNHPKQVRLWICCRPTDAVLYILLSCEQPLLTGATCMAGTHQSAAMVAAAALANVFVILTKKLDEDTDVIKQMLLDGMHVYGHLMPDQTKRDVQLFNNVLVPVVPFANLEHICHSTGERRCCSKHFQRICKEPTWTRFSDEIKHYFRAVQPVCSKKPARTVRAIMMECGYSYESGMAFQTMLKLILATMSTQGLQANPPLEVLKLHHISEKPWLDFQQKLIDALMDGKVDGQYLAGDSGHKIRLDIGAGKRHGGELVYPIAGTILGLLHGEDASKKGKLTRFPQLTLQQQGSIHKVMLEAAKVFCKPQQRSASHKDVPPVTLKSVIQQAFDLLTKHREDSCTAWMQASIVGQPFTGVETREKCQGLISRLGKHWHFCGQRCQAGNGCRYWCLLPKGHDPSRRHDCLDPEKSHGCEHDCTLCRRERRDISHTSSEADRRILVCKKAAGHQHDGGYENQLHWCRQSHLCTRQCSLRCARGCKVNTASPLSGTCTKRMDHMNKEGENDSTCICDVKWEHHLCCKPCLLNNYGNCNELCNKPFGDANHTPHLCGSVHKCLRPCLQPGVCLVADSTSVSDGTRLKNGINGFQLTCHYSVQKDAIHHNMVGECYCGRQHMCDRVCPYCKRFCTKDYGHTKLTGQEALCRVDHGRIIESRVMKLFVGFGAEILEVGDSEEVRCDNICTKAGRGHSHYQPGSKDMNLLTYHANSPGLRANQVWHSVFWAMLGFEDPYRDQDRTVFMLCPHVCPRHDDGAASHCTGQLWHKHFDSVPDGQSGYVGQERDGPQLHGHHFVCSGQDHLCEQECTVLQRYHCRHSATCPNTCKLHLGHGEKGCDCKSGQHVCGKPCTKNNLCGNSCALFVETGTHKCCCSDLGCPEPCEICHKPNSCVATKQHIHELDDGELHHCGEEHPCTKVCEADGLCYVMNPEDSNSEEPPGDRIWKRLDGGAFRLKCKDVYPVGKASHKKSCNCGKEHNCSARCPHCGRYCMLNFDHSGEHQTKHGIVTDISKLIVKKACGKLLDMDNTMDLKCDQLCDTADRGHEHVVQCPKPCFPFPDGHRHPPSSEHLVRHDVFWKISKFQDPYEESGLAASLSGCHVVCPHSAHENSKVYCRGKQNHQAFTLASQLLEIKNGGYVGHERDGKVAGHSFECNDHKCADLGHTCEWLNQDGCHSKCNLRVGHTGGCNCRSGSHICGNKCAGTNCAKKCIMLMERTHNENECSCGTEACQMMCAICKELKIKKPCQETKNHFHKVADDEVHHCGETHPCDEECKAEGMCGLTSHTLPHGVQVKKLDGTNGLKLQCAEVRQPGKRSHGDLHSCGRKHTCTRQCEFCHFYCEQEFGHDGLCRISSHGIAEFKGMKRVIRYSGEREEWLGKATCNQMCIAVGMGHRHIMSCSCTEETVPAYKLGRYAFSTATELKQQGTRLHYKSKSSRDLDLVLHSEFWMILNPHFADPALENAFDGCPVMCPVCKKNGKMVSCAGNVDHNLYAPWAVKGSGYVSPKLKDFGACRGHKFLCGGHLCGRYRKGCSLMAGGKRCPADCALPLGHIEEKCQCESKEHICGLKCAAAAGCNQLCMKDANDNHHRSGCSCSLDHCTAECDHEQCSELCSRGHIHGKTEVPGMFLHYCDKEHVCLQWCTVKGVCEIGQLGAGEGREGLKPFLKTKNGFRRQCSVKCRKGFRRHQKTVDCHCSVPQDKHTCIRYCPMCFLMCKQSYNHTGNHQVLYHGHMVSESLYTVFLADQKTKLRCEQKSCAEVCRDAGRGHTHKRDGIVPHCHSDFWKSAKFEDPCSAKESAFLDGCPEYCSREHDDGAVEYCTETLGHASVTEASGGYLWPTRIGTDNVLHHFCCDKHECGDPCLKLREGKACHGFCTLPLGHSKDLTCTCGVPHKCGDDCSAENCGKKCQLNLEEHKDHDHDCKSLSKCPSTCEHCGRDCYSKDHVHKIHEGESVLHHCGEPHVCQMSNVHDKRPVCEVEPEANCRQLAPPDDELLPGDTKLRDYCSRVIPIGQHEHQGPHCHSNDWVETGQNGVKHYCNERCRTCGNCCKFHHGHSTPHNTKHGKGSVKLSGGLIVVEGSSVDIHMGRRVQREKQNALTCTQVCEVAGRGHLHTAPCSRSSDCPFVGKFGSIMHDEKHGVDIASHEAYYASNLAKRFVDCSSEESKKTFALCGKKCPHPDHTDQEESRAANKAICSLPVLHEPIKDENMYGQNYCADGHVFDWHRCNNNCEYLDKTVQGTCDFGGECSKKLGHDGCCNCGVERHPCKEQCAVHKAFAELCNDRCKYSCEDHETRLDDHDSASLVCDKVHCTGTCSEEGCFGEACGREHTHVIGEQKKRHTCNEHLKPRCGEVCSIEGGMCQILLGSKEDPDSYLHPQSEVKKGWKAQCRMTHTSANRTWHWCKQVKPKHFCMFQCPLCGFYCTQTLAEHGNKHTVDHGFVGKGYVRVYKADLQPLKIEKPTLCQNICRIAGRGHFHAWACETQSSLCFHVPGERVHCKGDFDLIPHGQFFEKLKLLYPYSAIVADFDKCGEVCHVSAEKSSITQCDLQCLHIEPWPNSPTDLADGMQTLRGHSFPTCRHKCKQACQECALAGVEGSCDFLEGHAGLQDGIMHSCLKHCTACCPICLAKCFFRFNDGHMLHNCQHKKFTKETPDHIIWKETIIRLQYQAQHKLQSSIGQTCGEFCKSAGKNHKHVIQECKGGEECQKDQAGLVDHEWAVKLSYCDTASHDNFWRYYKFADPSTVSHH